MRTNPFIALTLVMAFSSSSHSQWALEDGPWIGSVKALANGGGDTLFAASSEGLFLSTNRGGQWVAIQAPVAPMYALTVSGPFLIAGTQYGIYYSSLQTFQWYQSWDSYGTVDLEAGQSAVYAAQPTGNLVLRSTNHGGTWTSVSAGLIDVNYYSLETKGDTVLAGGSLGTVNISTDEGQSWADVSIPGIVDAVVCLLINDEVILAGTSGETYRSTDTGQSWVRVDSGIAGSTVLSLTTNGPDIFAGTRNGGVFLSTDNGISWTRINSDIMYGYIELLSVDEDLIAGSDGGGIFMSSDRGNNWFTRSVGITRLWVRALSSRNSREFAGGCCHSSGIYSASGTGTVWTPTGLGGNNVEDLLSTGFGMYAGTWSGVYLSTDDGENWSSMNNGLADLVVQCMFGAMDTLILGSSSGVYRSTNRGNDWTTIGMEGFSPRSVLSGNGFLFAGIPQYYQMAEEGGVYRSTGDGVWTRVGLAGLSVNSLVYVNQDLFAAVEDGFTGGGGVYRSTDNGTTWTNLLSGSASVIKAIGRNILVGRENGLFRSTDNGDHWVDKSNGQFFSVDEIDIGENDVLVSAGGVWRRPLSEVVAFEGSGDAKSLELGNKWFYVTDSELSGRALTVETAVSDTSIDGRVFRRIAGQIIMLEPPSTSWTYSRFERSDSILVEEGYFCNEWTIETITDFSLSVGETLQTTTGSLVVSNRGDSTIFSEPVTFLDVIPSGCKYSSLVEWREVYSTKFGLLLQWSSESGRTTTKQLVGSVIEGTLYGDTTLFEPPDSILPAATPLLVSPSNGTTDQPTNTTLTWRAASDANAYRLQISRDPGFLDNDYNLPGISDTTWNGLLISSTKYFWRVAGVNALGESEFTSPFFFITEGEVPQSFVLDQNYPNPFNGSTIIRFGVPHETSASVTLYDAIGRRVRILFSGTVKEGYHEVTVDAKHFASGIYWYEMVSDGYRDRKKLMLLR